MKEMHIADRILQEINEEKIADIFAEPEKTKVLLQLKELGLIKISEAGVAVTEEGTCALEKGIKSYFAHKRATRCVSETMEAEVKKKVNALSILGVVIAVPATLLLLLLFLLLIVMDMGT